MAFHGPCLTCNYEWLSISLWARWLLHLAIVECTASYYICRINKLEVVIMNLFQRLAPGLYLIISVTASTASNGRLWLMLIEIVFCAWDIGVVACIIQYYCCAELVLWCRSDVDKTVGATAISRQCPKTMYESNVLARCLLSSSNIRENIQIWQLMRKAYATHISSQKVL